MPTGDVLDPEVVQRLRQLTPPGEPDVLAEILTVFLAEVPKRIDMLRAAAAAGDARGVQRAAHSLKGSSGNIGARDLHDLCRRLDEDARAGQLERIQPLVAALDGEYRKVEAAIERLLEGAR
jgi:HPt (histidine-containing phosphotransfer) domain-containing protein